MLLTFRCSVVAQSLLYCCLVIALSFCRCPAAVLLLPRRYPIVALSLPWDCPAVVSCRCPAVARSATLRVPSGGPPGPVCLRPVVGRRPSPSPPLAAVSRPAATQLARRGVVRQWCGGRLMGRRRLLVVRRAGAWAAQWAVRFLTMHRRGRMVD